MLLKSPAHHQYVPALNGIMGRMLLVLLLGVSIVTCQSVHSVHSIGFADNNTDYHQRADLAIQSFLLHFWNGGASYINANYPANGVTQYWNFAQGFDAVLDAIERTHTEQYYGWANTFYNTQEKIGWLRTWYDDENWMAMALVRAHDIALTVGDTKAASNYLSAATTLLNDIAGGWDTTCCGSLKGGIWWDKTHSSKATASNAGPVILAARMYERTGNQQYLNWAVQWFTFWSTNMVSSSYEIADNYGPSGTRVWWKFTYNSGLMVGAAVELFKATKDSKYLSLAHNYASFMLTNMTVTSKYGPVLTDGSSSSCGGDCREFKGPGYRYLMYLYQNDPSNSKNVYNLLQASAQAVWNLGRDPTRNMFSVDWVESLPSNAVVSDSQQNVASMALSLWAQNYGPYPGTGYPKGRYEAENGQLTQVGLEASYAGFTGWGYVAGWGADGQAVSVYFLLNTTSYSVSFRYANGQNSVRVLQVDGNVVNAKMTFPSTGGYGTYGSVSSGKLTAPTGYHTITLIYESNQGSTGFINLDSLTISGN